MDKWVEMEKANNRVPKDSSFGHECDWCDETCIDSMFLHRHVCPNDPEHRENYDTAYLERALLGE